MVKLIPPRYNIRPAITCILWPARGGLWNDHLQFFCPFLAFIIVPKVLFVPHFQVGTKRIVRKGW